MPPSAWVHLADDDALRDPVARLEDGPDAPEGTRIDERITMHEYQVSRIARLEPAGMLDAQQFSAPPADRGQRLAWLEPRLDQQLDFPREMSGPHRAAAEVGSGRDSNAGAPGRLDGGESAFPSSRQLALPL